MDDRQKQRTLKSKGSLMGVASNCPLAVAIADQLRYNKG